MRAGLLRCGDDPHPARAGGRLSFYGSELARVHDEGFGDFARAAAGELLDRLAPHSTIVELGCGSGISCEILANAGHDVLGIDLSEAMLALARRRAPAASFRHGSIWDAALPPCDAVTAVGEVVNYAADERAGAERLPELFGRVHAALRPGGIFLFDFATHGRGTLGAGPGTREGPGWRIEYAATEDAERAALERRHSLLVDGRPSEETHALRLYDADAVRGQLASAGFEPERLSGYRDFAFWPGYAAFAALRDR